MKNFVKLTIFGAALTASSAFAIPTTITTYAGAVNGTEFGQFNSSVIVGGSATYTEAFGTDTSVFNAGTFSNFTLVQNGSSPSNPAFVRQDLAGIRQTQVAGSTETETYQLKSGNLLTAFGADFDLSPFGAGQGVLLTITFTDNSTQQLALALGSLTGTNFTDPFFFGFTSTTSFSSVTLSGGSVTPGQGSETFNVDNLRLEQAGTNTAPPSGVPEPSTFGLLGAAMVGLGFVRRFRR